MLYRSVATHHLTTLFTDPPKYLSKTSKEQHTLLHSINYTLSLYASNLKPSHHKIKYYTHFLIDDLDGQDLFA